MSEFYQGMAEVLEMDPADVTPELKLTDVAWDSLAVVSTIALIDEVFDVAVSADALNGCETIGDIERLATAEKASG